MTETGAVGGPQALPGVLPRSWSLEPRVAAARVVKCTCVWEGEAGQGPAGAHTAAYLRTVGTP